MHATKRHPTRPKREPHYTSEPLYARFRVDGKGSVAWAALDRSSRDCPWYDVLYFDADGSGDLTNAANRFVGDHDEKYVAEGHPGWIPIHVPDVPVAGTRGAHALTVSAVTVGRRTYVTTFVERRPGHGVVAMQNWARRWARAPLLDPSMERPLAFMLREHLRPVLELGKANEVSCFISNGAGFQLFNTFLVAGRDRIRATLAARDAKGREVATRTEITGRC
jgi:hypothetical protein